MDYNRLAELLFPDVTLTPDDMEAKYPERDLPEGAKVTRIAPSPTGFSISAVYFPRRSVSVSLTSRAACFICA